VPQLIATALKQQVIILDELGFIPFSERGAQLIFQFCSALHERVALIVTTNLRFADWTQVFGNPSLTAALLDRLTARAHILEFVGESYRLRQQPARRSPKPSMTEVVAVLQDKADDPGPSPHVPG
jgi:DNA replication protein DnaC